jgi:transposase
VNLPHLSGGKETAKIALKEKEQEIMSSRHHSEEFKREAVKLVLSSEKGVAQIAEDLGINSRTLYGWVAEGKRQGKEAASSGVSKLKGGELAREVKRLQAELAVVKAERDILKKAIRVFSRE